MKLEAYNKPSHKWENYFVIGLKERDKQNIKSDFKNVKIKNTKTFIRVKYTKALTTLIRIYQE